MSYKLKKKVYTPQLEEGWFPATINQVDINEQVMTKFSTEPKDQCTIHFDIDGVVIKKTMNISISPKATLFDIFKGITGKAPQADDDLEESLIGKTCEVRIDHSDPTEEGAVFERVGKTRQRTYKPASKIDVLASDDEDGLPVPKN